MSQLRISLIVAMGANRAIGKDGAMPWHMPADLRRFKQLTLGKPVLMGRRTFEAIGRPLPDRRNIVVSRTPGYGPEGCEVVADLGDALARAGNVPEIMVIGGATLYTQILPRADRIYLTRIDAEFEADTWFPALDSSEWAVMEREEHPADGRNPFPYAFIRLDRIMAKAGPEGASAG